MPPKISHHNRGHSEINEPAKPIVQTLQRAESSYAPSSFLDGKSPRKEGSGSGGSIISQTPAPIRKDPNEEFFMMTFLSYKLNHKEYEKILAVRKYIPFMFKF